MLTSRTSSTQSSHQPSERSWAHCHQSHVASLSQRRARRACAPAQRRLLAMMRENGRAFVVRRGVPNRGSKLDHISADRVRIGCGGHHAGERFGAFWLSWCWASSPDRLRQKQMRRGGGSCRNNGARNVTAFVRMKCPLIVRRPTFRPSPASLPRLNIRCACFSKHHIRQCPISYFNPRTSMTSSAMSFRSNDIDRFSDG
jgi:hypothetical protein